jgi:hypothetical protein
VRVRGLPTNLYNRVDVYDPAANWWRLGAIMPTARHGIFSRKDLSKTTGH